MCSGDRLLGGLPLTGSVCYFYIVVTKTPLKKSAKGKHYLFLLRIQTYQSIVLADADCGPMMRKGDTAVMREACGRGGGSPHSRQEADTEGKSGDQTSPTKGYIWLPSSSK